MKQVFSGKTELEAHEVRLFLESQGINASVVGENTAFTNFSLTPSMEPAVMVEDGDFENAVELVEKFVDRAFQPPTADPWNCPSCGKVIEPQFDACWSCGSHRPENASAVPCEGEQAFADAETREDIISQLASTEDVASPKLPHPNARAIQLEVLTLLAICWMPMFAYSVYDWLIPKTEPSAHFFADYVVYIVSLLASATTVVYFMHRSGEPWEFFGIRSFRPLSDIGLSLAILFSDAVARTMVLLALFLIVVPSSAQEQIRSSYEFDPPVAWYDWLIFAVACVAIGTYEELLNRAYLIPRLEQLSGSTGKSILFSSMIFASYHLYQGVSSLLLIFVTGLVLGCAFCLIRRIWPLIIAHAIFDLLAA